MRLNDWFAMRSVIADNAVHAQQIKVHYLMALSISAALAAIVTLR